MNQKDLVVVAVAVDYTDDELIQDMRMMKVYRYSGRCMNIRLLIAGYDDDPRELFEIPEVAELCKRLIRIGYISYLDFGNAPWSEQLPAFGAAEIILCAKGKLRKEILWTPESTHELFREWVATNSQADAIVDAYRNN